MSIGKALIEESSKLSETRGFTKQNVLKIKKIIDIGENTSIIILSSFNQYTSYYGK
jgi:hypothetical protein